MAIYIEPVFTNPLSLQYPDDLITFLARLRGFSITRQDVIAYQAWKAGMPTRDVDETYRHYFARLLIWRWLGTDNNLVFHALWKWDGYRLGKPTQSVEAYLASIGNNPNTLIRKRQVVRLQLQSKWAREIASLDINGLLIPLVTGLVW